MEPLVLGWWSADRVPEPVFLFESGVNCSMNWQYSYTPYIWPMLASGVFMSVLSVYAWRRRSVAGALPLAIAMLLAALWAASAALELAATDIQTKIFWDQFAATAARMPLAIARFCFVLAFASLGYLLTRRNLVLLCIPPLLVLFLALTNDAHHLLVRSFVYDGTIRPQEGVAGWMMTGFAYLLLMVNLIILARLFIRSPSRRWPAALIIFSMLTTHAVFLLDALDANPVAPLDATVLSMNVAFVVYAVALFRFHIFDPIPASRKTAIEQMREGMLVVDASGKIVDLNPTMETILGPLAARVRGRNVAEVLPACAGVSAGKAQAEISLTTNSALRHYELSLSALIDRGDVLIGHLLLLHDVTERKQAQAQLLEQQRSLAMLQERERLARELHDQLAQELSFINIQTQAALALLESGQTARAEAVLLRLAEIARQTQMDVREMISFLINAGQVDRGLLDALRQTVEGFSQKSGIQVNLRVPDPLPTPILDPTVELHLLRITQESLTNIRKHACARQAWVSLAYSSAWVELTVEDDGVGFTPSELSGNDEQFGLRIMAERATEIGGSLQVSAEPGCGTQVVVRIPVGGRVDGESQ